MLFHTDGGEGLVSSSRCGERFKISLVVDPFFLFHIFSSEIPALLFMICVWLGFFLFASLPC